MRYWRLDRPRQGSPSGSFDLTHVTGLVAAIGGDDANALAAEVLNLLGPATSVSQCTVFAYEFGNRPRTVSVADHRGGRFLRDVADTYARLFYALDGNQRIVTGDGEATEKPSSLVLHWQSSEDIAHDGYRQTCYAAPNVSDRLSLLMQPAADILSLIHI